MQTKSPFERWGGRGLGQETITELARTVHWTVRLVHTLLAKPTPSPTRPTKHLASPSHFALCGRTPSTSLMR